MRKYGVVLAMVGLAMSIAVTASAGGQARVEVSQAPKQVQAGQRFELAIQGIPESWAHRRNIEPLVVAQCGDLKVTTTAVALSQANRYQAKLALPSAGAWKVSVDSRYCHTVMKPIEIQALSAATAKRAS